MALICLSFAHGASFCERFQLPESHRSFFLGWLQPKWRRIGTALPGYQAGWFRLRNGEKALLYLTDRTRAVYIPTTAGYSLLLSPADPDAYLSRLRAVLGS